jgi:hypothetical protein
MSGWEEELYVGEYGVMWLDTTNPSLNVLHQHDPSKGEFVPVTPSQAEQIDGVQQGVVYNGTSIDKDVGFTVVNSAGETIGDLGSEAGGFESLNVGVINSPSVLNVNRVSQAIDVTENVQQVIDGISDMNNATITILFANDISEDLQIKNFLGDGSIVIDLNGKKLNGHFDIQANAGQYVNLKNGTINSDFTDIIDVDRSTYVRIENVVIYGKVGVTERGVYSHAGANVHCENVTVWNCNSALTAATAGTLSTLNGGGRGEQYGLHAFSGGFIIADGTIPTGDVANTMQASGYIAGSYSEPTPPVKPTPPPPPENTTRWESNDSANWGTLYGWDDSRVIQGNYGYGRRTGFWFFPNTIASTLSGKTIKSARCYVKRKSTGGSSGKVPIYIHHHGYEDKPSGTPDKDLSGSEEKRIDLAWGEGSWVTLPSSFYNNFANGTAKGLGIYVASDSRSNYAIMDEDCTLEVTYS